MAWLLDTNVWINHLKNPGGPVEQRLNGVAPSEILLCSVVKAEFWHGAHKYERRERRLIALEKMFQPFVSLPFDDAAARHYGTIRHELETYTQVIGPNDLKIAAICLANGLTLVSSNTGELSDNARYHHAKLHAAWRAEQEPEFQLSYLPPYSPELNPIERVGKVTRRLCLHNRYFPTLAGVMAAVEGQFGYWLRPNEPLRKQCSVA